MNNDKQVTIEDVIAKLPRSVVDVNPDGSVYIHPVDMIQAQMDREKEFKALLEQNHALHQEILKLQSQLRLTSEPEVGSEPNPDSVE